MESNYEILKKVLEKIKNTPDEIIENAIESLAQKIEVENTKYTLIINYLEVFNNNNKFEIESENEICKEQLQIVA